MDGEKLEEIAARAAAASPGPWRCISDPCDDEDHIQADGDSSTLATSRRYIGAVQPSAEGEFIAHAREDVPALVAEVRRLLAMLEQRAGSCRNCGAVRSLEPLCLGCDVEPE